MDDLSGLNWTVPATNSTSKPPPLNSPSYYPAFRPTPPLSGRSTPSTLQPLGSKSKLPIEPNARSNSTTPVNDSFANLVSFNSSHTTKNLSLQDQQKIILEQRLKEEENQRKQSNIQIPPRDGHFWDNLGDGRATPNRLTNPPTYAGTDEYGGQKLSNTINRPFVGISNDLRQPQTKQSIEDERDLLSAFDASAPVDSSSNFPVPSQIAKNHVYGGINREAASQKRDNASALEELAGAGADHLDKMDDDPFNLGTVGNKQLINGTSGGKMADDDDDDVLGLLGRPVSEMPPTIPREQRSLDIVTRVDTSDPLDQALAELMDMGFSPDKSSKALATTQSGIDVQAAVGWLLNQAHEDSRDKTASRQSQRDNSESTETSRPRRASRRTTGTETDEPVPAWMRQQNRPDRQKSRSPANGEKDPAQYATELGSNLFKTANTLWKTGTKKLNQAVSELNSDSDSNQPKWMKEGQGEAEERSTRQRKTAVNGSHDASARSQQRPYPTTAVKPNITDEALMLESGDNRPLSSKVLDRSKASSRTRGSDSSRDQSPSILTRSRDQELPPPRFMSQERAKDPKAKLSRYVVEEQTSQAYVSPARRKKPTSKPSSSEPDLLFDSSQPNSKPHPQSPLPSRPSQAQSILPSKPSLPYQPPLPTRTIPPISPSALQTSIQNRQAGTTAFKQGDYAQATTLYTVALSPLPLSHPLSILLLTNRSLTLLKTGDPKASLADATAALTVIGPSRGSNETIDLGTEGKKEMSIFWSKAMTRQAEALEQLERWSEATAIWRACVEAGVGGATSIQGRNRCEKAAGGPLLASSAPFKRVPPRKSAPTKPIPQISALADLSGHPIKSLSTIAAESTEAVTRLRAANVEAARMDDEKFALTERVDERVGKWRKGKEGNLRALLASLEGVLGEGSGWKKVGMGELIVPGRVKVVYMRGIGKVHPDKLPLEASTETRMVSAAVFATLNEAWEGFKKENGL